MANCKGYPGGSSCETDNEVSGVPCEDTEVLLMEIDWMIIFPRVRDSPAEPSLDPAVALVVAGRSESDVCFRDTCVRALCSRLLQAGDGDTTEFKLRANIKNAAGYFSLIGTVLECLYVDGNQSKGKREETGSGGFLLVGLGGEENCRFNPIVSNLTASGLCR